MSYRFQSLCLLIEVTTEKDLAHRVVVWNESGTARTQSLLLQTFICFVHLLIPRMIPGWYPAVLKKCLLNESTLLSETFPAHLTLPEMYQLIR